MKKGNISILDLNEKEIAFFCDGWKDVEQRAVLTDIIGSGNSICMSIVLNDSYSWEQRECIRSGFASGLAYEEVMVYASKDFDWEQMDELKYSLLSIGVEKTMTYADTKFSSDQMSVLRQGYELGLDKKEMELVINPDYEQGQMMEIIYGMVKGLSKEELVYANKDIPASVMRDIRRQLMKNKKINKKHRLSNIGITNQSSRR